MLVFRLGMVADMIADFFRLAGAALPDEVLLTPAFRPENLFLQNLNTRQKLKGQAKVDLVRSDNDVS